jgi:hypothetical protein
MLSLYLLAAHMVGDFILQGEWIASRKLSDWRVRALHVTLYVIPFALISPDARFLASLWALHFLVDCRRWCASNPWPLKTLAVDQSLHVATIAALGAAFLG